MSNWEEAIVSLRKRIETVEASNKHPRNQLRFSWPRKELWVVFAKWKLYHLTQHDPIYLGM